MTAVPARHRFARLLEGRGLEIGALNRPTPAPRASQVLFADCLLPEALERLYPGLPPPDILSDSQSFPTVADGAFDFVIACHVLEHLTDPIGALREWHRILRPGGRLLLALPDKRYTFDRGRRRTPLAHLLEDHRSPLPPKLKNLPHLLEWATHVERLPEHGPEWGRFVEAQFGEDYSVHNHVWVVQDALRIFLHLARRTEARFAPLRWANTARHGDEFVLLMEARKASSALETAAVRTRLAAALGRAWIENPFQVAQAAAKRAWRGRRAVR